ncbi:MAG: hypothetical protein Q7T25_00620 [Sideroxyarcus sp.]|nr:hypothetical protein [Sideroxyarcus sp.]
MNLDGRQLTFARSPAGLFVILAVSLFVAEVIAMLLLAELPTMPPMLTNFLDATILVVLAFPALRAHLSACKHARADRTRLWLHLSACGHAQADESVHERILPTLHWAKAQRGGDWLDQPDLQPGPLRTDCAVEAAATARRLKSED